jgi:hypothetical protein
MNAPAKKKSAEALFPGPPAASAGVNVDVLS